MKNPSEPESLHVVPYLIKGIMWTLLCFRILILEQLDCKELLSFSRTALHIIGRFHSAVAFLVQRGASLTSSESPINDVSVLIPETWP